MSKNNTPFYVNQDQFSKKKTAKSRGSNNSNLKNLSSRLKFDGRLLPSLIGKRRENLGPSLKNTSTALLSVLSYKIREKANTCRSYQPVSRVL